MIKPDSWIKEFGSNGNIKPFVEEHVNPASYDVTLGNHFISPTRDPEDVISEEFVIFPGEVVLACTQEEIIMPKEVCGLILLKSSLGRLWLNHSLSGWVDPGFCGQLTLELQNLGPWPRVLRAGTRIAQIVFFELSSPPLLDYSARESSHYKNQKGATRSWSESFFQKKVS